MVIDSYLSISRAGLLRIPRNTPTVFRGASVPISLQPQELVLREVLLLLALPAPELNRKFSLIGLRGRQIPLTSHSAPTGPSSTGSHSGADSNSSSASGSKASPTTGGGPSPSSNAAGGLVVGGSFAGLFAMAAGILVL